MPALVRQHKAEAARNHPDGYGLLCIGAGICFLRASIARLSGEDDYQGDEDDNNNSRPLNLS